MRYSNKDEKTKEIFHDSFVCVSVLLLVVTIVPM